MAGKATAMDVKMLVATLPEGTNLSEWCRRLGVSRQTAYKWRERYRVDGIGGLVDRSRAPRNPHGRTAASVEDLVVGIRKELAEEGLDFGPASVADRLREREGIVRSDSTVYRILLRRGQINAHPAKRPRSSWKRFARQRPNECWQGDDTHYVLVSGQEVRVINMIDDHSRLNVESLAVVQCRSARIWEAFCRAVERHGLPAEFLNDNGRAWRSEDGFSPVTFEAGLIRVGVRQIHSSPYHPQTCGKVERFHQTQRKWLDAHPQAVTVTELQQLLDQFRHVYNHQRPHRAIGRRTPASVWAAQPPATPPQAAGQAPLTVATCVVGADGRIRPGNQVRIGLGRKHTGKTVTVIRQHDTATVIDTSTGEIIRQITVEPGRLDHGTRPHRNKRRKV